MSDIAGTYVTIRPDLSGFGEELRGKLEGEDASKNVRIGADTTDARAKVDELNARLAKFGHETVGPTVRLGGAEETNAKLSVLIAQLDAFGRKDETAHVKVKDDTSGGSEGFLKGLVGWLVALGPAAEGVGAVMVGALAGVPALFGGMGLAALATGGAIDGLKKTLQDYSAANTDTGQTAQQAHQQLVTLQADYKNLSPAALGLVNVLEGQLLPAWHQFVGADQTALFGAAQSGIADLLPMFRDITPFALQAARGIGQTFSEMGQWSTSTTGLHDINTILAQGNQLMSSLGGDAEKVFEAFANIGAQRAQFGDLGTSIDHISSAFLKWTQDGGSEKFLAYLHQVTPEVRQDFDDLGRILSTVAQDWAKSSSAYLLVGGDLLNIVNALAKMNPLLVEAAPLALGLYKAFNAIKGLDLAANLAKIGAALGAGSGIAGEAEAASTQISSLKAGLAAIAGLGAIVVTIDVIEQIQQEYSKLTSNVQKQKQGQDQSVYTQAALDAAKAKGNKALYNQILQEGKTAAAQDPYGSIDFQKILGLTPYKVDTNPSTLSKSNSSITTPYAASVPGAATGYGPGQLSPAQQLAQTLTSSAQSMLATLGSLGEPAKNAVVAQQQALRNNAPQLSTLIDRIVAAHQSALTALIPQLVAAHRDAMAQLVQLQKAQTVQLQTAAINARVASSATTASGIATSTTDAAALNAAKIAAAAGGNIPALRAAVNVAQVQKSTDAIVSAQQAKVDAAQAAVARAAINGTQLEQAQAAKRLAIAQEGLQDAKNSQQKELAAANAALTAAQAEKAAADQQEQTMATLAADGANAFSAMAQDISKAATDLSTGMATLVSDASTAFTDWSNATVAAIQDAAQKLHDEMTGQIQAVTDQSTITIDQLAERGKSGYALQAAQAKVALDQMTAAYNQQINALQVGNVDAAKAAQDQIVAAARANLDSVTRQQQAAVNSATQQADAMVTSAQYTANAAQAVVDQAGTAATNDQKLALANAQAALTTAQANGSSIVAAAQAAQQQAVTQAQAFLAQAQGNAAILEARGAAAEQAVTDQANLAEAQQRAIYDKLSALANGSGGTQVTVEINSMADPLAIVDQMMAELRLSGVV